MKWNSYSYLYSQLQSIILYCCQLKAHSWKEQYTWIHFDDNPLWFSDLRYWIGALKDYIFLWHSNRQYKATYFVCVCVCSFCVTNVVMTLCSPSSSMFHVPRQRHIKHIIPPWQPIRGKAWFFNIHKKCIAMTFSKVPNHSLDGILYSLCIITFSAVINNVPCTNKDGGSGHTWVNRGRHEQIIRTSAGADERLVYWCAPDCPGWPKSAFNGHKLVYMGTLSSGLVSKQNWRARYIITCACEPGILSAGCVFFFMNL